LLLTRRRGLGRAQALPVLLAVRLALTGVGFLPHPLHLPQEQAHPQLGRLRRRASQGSHLLLSLLEHRLEALEQPGSGRISRLQRCAKGEPHLLFRLYLDRLADGLALLHQRCDLVQPLLGPLGVQFGLGHWIGGQRQTSLFGEKLHVVQGLARQAFGRGWS
jgi:hypothetical protein